MLVAAHGIGPLRHASWNLNQILDLLGLSGRASAVSAVPGLHTHDAPFNPWRTLRMAVPSRWQYTVKERLPKAWQDHLLFLWSLRRTAPRGTPRFATSAQRHRQRDSCDLPAVIAMGSSLPETSRGASQRNRGSARLAHQSEKRTNRSSRRNPATARVQRPVRGTPAGSLRQVERRLRVARRPMASIQRAAAAQARLPDRPHTPHGFLLARGPGFPSVRRSRSARFTTLSRPSSRAQAWQCPTARSAIARVARARTVVRPFPGISITQRKSHLPDDGEHPRCLPSTSPVCRLRPFRE